MSNNPTTILTDTSGNQIGTNSNPFCVSGSLVAAITINNYVTVGASGSQGEQGPTGSQGPAYNIPYTSGTWRDPGNTFVTTGSVSIDTGNRIASSIGTDVFFFVSGSITSSSDVNRKVTVLGGDIVSSGSVSCLNGLTGSLQRTIAGLSYLVAGANCAITSASNGQITIASTVAGSSAPVTGTWRDPGNTFVTTGSVSIDTGNRTASTIGTDVFFFVSGSQNVPSGANRKIVLFGGGTVNSGTILQKNLSVHPTVSPVSGCLFSSHSGSMYRLTSSGSLQVLGEKYITIALPTGSNYTLTPDEYSATIIKFTAGKSTGPSTVFVPLIAGNRWTIQAGSTTWTTVVISGPTGLTVETSGPNVTVGCDGTDIFLIKSDVDLTLV